MTITGIVFFIILAIAVVLSGYYLYIAKEHFNMCNGCEFHKECKKRLEETGKTICEIENENKGY